MKNVLLNYNRDELFEDIVESGVFEYYDTKLSMEDYNNLLNDVCHFCSSLAHQIVRE